ncbi:MAG: HDOD domain-containing protein, partial [Dechloromonas sp.]|nr:HDOD domain-containing protein [Dechloromonas sp.]
DPGGDPHKAQLLNLLRLVQGDAETAEIADAMKQDPVLSFRVLRYLNSPMLGLTRRIDSLEQALIILGRQRLTRWLAVLLFSVREPQMSDWLLVENALTRGRLMELLAERLMPGQPHDPFFLTGIFSCLNRLLHRPLADILATLPIADEIRQALLERSGPYAPLLAVAEQSEELNQSGMSDAAQSAGVTPDMVNRALLAATAWASEVTEYWE